MAERKEPFLSEDASAPVASGPALPRGAAAGSEGLTAINPAAAALPVRPELIFPTWPAPSWVRAVCTTRRGGFGEPPYDQQNLASHVGDDAGAVRDNRANLIDALRLEREPAWLTQVHGSTVARAEKVIERAGGPPPEADACVTSKAGYACTVLVADCLPVLFCDRSGHRVGAAHAGWRGLAGGVLEATVDALGVAPASVLAWFGPAIGPEKFEVGAEVRTLFIEHDLGADECFAPVPGVEGKYLCDIFKLAKRRLKRIGVTQVYGGGICTHSDPGSFFSYRRDGQTGRMAALIWMQPGGDRR